MITDIKEINQNEVKLPDTITLKWKFLAFSMFLIGAILSVISFSNSITGFYFSYLVAFVFWLTFMLGGLFFVLVQHITKAGWSVTVRRIAETIAGTAPLFVGFFIPVVLGLKYLYPWVSTEHIASDEALIKKVKYLNPTFFLLRSAGYLLVWSLISFLMRKYSSKQDTDGDLSWTRKLQRLSPGFTILFAVSLTFASFDWIMSLNPHWYSTIFGVYFFAGSALAVFSIMSIIGVQLHKNPETKSFISVEHLHDLGKFLFGFTVFWAYIAFSQFFLIWYANIPEETIFYMVRWKYGWSLVSLSLLFGQFVIQFIFLLPRTSKRTPWMLLLASIWVIVFHWIDIYWLIMPNFTERHGFTTISDLGPTFLMGGFVVLFGIFLIRRKSIFAIKDPRLAESLKFENI